MKIDNLDYQWEVLFNNQKPLKNISHWNSKFGSRILSRDQKGYANEVEINLLADNPKLKIYLVGDFNNWGKDNLEDYELKPDDFYVMFSIKTNNLKHKSKYKFLVIENEEKSYRQDPAGVYFDNDGNTIFWDFEDPNSYKQKYPLINNFNRSTKILQTDLPGLIAHFANKDNVCGKDVDKNNYYRFIAESGVIEYIKSLGYNTIQFLPFAQSIDGDNWKYRYLVPYQFAIQKNWGTPDEFAMMVDEFHKNNIAVIGDFVIGHLPDRDFNIFGQDAKSNGIHLWTDRNKESIYLKDHTPWGTRRINFDNSYVRKFFVSSCLHFLKYYRIDGFRIDNVDGIIRYGDNGDGDERPNGRRFLKEINSTIYDFNPSALINYEAHFYWGDNSKMLVAPINSDRRALGATAYNSSRLTYYFHTEYMFKAADLITVWKFKHINDEMEWGKSNSTIADFHNHDAAAGLMEMRCTGSYAYDAMTVSSKDNSFHAIGKIKVMEAIISFCCEGRTLNLAQTFLLQEGTFEHDSSIHWFLTMNKKNNDITEFKKKINNLMDIAAFWPLFTSNRKFLNVDDKNKVLVIQRTSNYKGVEEKYLVVINLASWYLDCYKVGVTSKSNYKLIFNSDNIEFGGTGNSKCPDICINKESNSFELLDREIEIPVVAPYNIFVFKEE